jgi:signal transduction histidine kinase
MNVVSEILIRSLNISPAQNSKANILVVDDTPENLELLSTMLKEQGLNVRCAINGSLALKVAESGWSDLILLDIRMPGMDGYEVCQKLKTAENTREIPVIFLSALDDISDKKQAFAVGGVDYISKPFQVEEALARVTTHLQLRKLSKTLEQQVQERTIELSKALEKAEAANIAKSQFLANMSHELRTPLNAIIGYSDILKEEAIDLRKENIFCPDLEKIHSAAHHLLGIVNNILDLSKIESGKMEIYLEKIEVASLLKDVIATIQPLIQKNANTLVVEYPESAWAINIDVFKVRQSLFNLLSNANKFTEQGKISLTISSSNENQRDWIYFSVTDNGIGMSVEQIQKLFKPFTQADNSRTRKYGGTGLGLVLTQKFCQMMGGEITVESQLGRGSSFTIKLPTLVEVDKKVT